MIVGLGNPLRGDDGVGVRVAEMLAARDLPQGVEVVDGGTRGLELVNLMEGWPRVILVDAVHLGREPGEFVCFTLDQVRLSGVEQAPMNALASDHNPTQQARTVVRAGRPVGRVSNLSNIFQGALSIHDAGLREALLLAEVLGVLPAEVIIYGVQPAHLDWGEGLSPAVEAALPELVKTIEERL